MNKIYVGNLPYRVSEQEIEEFFAKFGAIENVALIKDRETGRAKGFGFVTFENPTAAQEALSMNGQEFQGRPLKVSLAKEKSTEGGSNGGGRGRGPGGGLGGRQDRRW